MLRDIAYSIVFGFPLVLWLGLATITLFSGALSVVAINKYTKMNIPFEWHMRLAGAGMAVGFIHAVLAISVYL